MSTELVELPPHLQRYVVDQDYASYTPRDQSVWRHVLKRLAKHLESRAHSSYLKGLAETGVGLDEIPSLEGMNEKLDRLGWRCVGVRGFVPPAVFTELQARGVLAIAADIRSHKTINYTPAPDIIHESAGHAPILADAAYAAYVRSAGEVGFKAIASAEDRALFEGIRNLSVVKEDPLATPDDVEHAQARLDAAAKSVRYVSESTRASRLYWWTAEYGLVGTLEQPKLYGAGLLSSIGEAEHCLTPEVKKLPLSVECANIAYDITRMQPQLFVARDFRHLNDVLADFKHSLAYIRGGDYGLDEALRSRAVNHLVLRKRGGDIIEITGEVKEVHRSGKDTGPGLTASVIELTGPTMISAGGKCTEIPKRIDSVVLIGSERLPLRGRFSVRLASGVEASGYVVDGHEVVDFRVWLHGRPVPVSTWAYVAVAEAIPSVAGGPADPQRWDDYFGALDSFTAGNSENIARQRKAEELPRELAALYSEVRDMRRSKKADRKRLGEILEASKRFGDEPLLREEVEELLTAN
ncbi:MAG: aromatic amino acid hydroxylase [Archangium gephyra]|uniref:Aromatic amino acid hydroxylase n=1 Tax=Archangium gephyra TaxID=48 RepID=A0A2W5T5X7_9BACT|nr:MAG: aromatic amino acid hydroxylase [Archangium gephyra]